MAFPFNSTNSNMSPSWMDAGFGGLEPRTAALATFLSIFASVLAYLSYTPKIDGRAPALTTDAVPFIGSWNFFIQKM